MRGRKFKIVFIFAIIYLFLPCLCFTKNQESISTLIKGEWKSNTFIYEGEKFPYRYLKIPENLSYCVADEIANKYPKGILDVFKNFVYHWQELNVDKIREFIVRKDLFQNFGDKEIKRMIEADKRNTNWKLTHLIEFENFIFLRGVYNTSRRKGIIDTWRFSWEDNQWKINILEREFDRRSEWFNGYLHLKKINLS